ncbi:MAG: hypothetical protein Q8K98_06105, partial [Bacteroidota bacterium]|nr:hypothetical protein [Bacteroidota bacterium]
MFIFLIFIFSTITFSQVPTVTTIDSVGDVGKYLSMKIDSSGKIWLSYYDATRQIIKIAHKENNNWMINEINQAKSSGNYTSMVIDPLNKISITFSDPVYNEVKYIGWLPIAPLANLSVIDSINNPGYYSLLTKDTLGNLAMTYVAEATK